MRRILFALALLLATAPQFSHPASAQIAMGVSVAIAPPPLPLYDQPPIPGPGYIWTPGYWAWDGGDYYWVPGTWVLPPAVDLLWTPGYWDFADGFYVWNAGYWGPYVGFYGGIDYGCGYFGHGYEGGYWNHDRFFYNRSVNNFGRANIANAYDRPVIHDAAINHASYNGGNGVFARPTSQELAGSQGRHFAPTALQAQQATAALRDPTLHMAQNHGAPPVMTTRLPGQGFQQTSAFGSRSGAPGPAITPNRANGALPALRTSGGAQVGFASNAMQGVNRPSQPYAQQGFRQPGVAPQRPAATYARPQIPSQPQYHPYAARQPAYQPRPNYAPSAPRVANFARPARSYSPPPRPQFQQRAQPAPRPASPRDLRRG